MLERVLGEVLFGDMYKEYVLHNGCRIFYEEYLGSSVESPVFFYQNISKGIPSWCATSMCWSWVLVLVFQVLSVQL